MDKWLDEESVIAEGRLKLLARSATNPPGLFSSREERRRLSAKTTGRHDVDPNRQPGLRIAQVFLSHVHFDYRADPRTLNPPDSTTQVQMNVGVQVLDLVQENGPPVAGVRVRVRSDPASVHPYVFDVSMGAVIESEPGEENYNPKDYVVNAGAALLYPFVREVIANITQRGRFGAVWIPPFNMQLVMSGAAAEK